MKLIVLIISAVFLVSITGCGGGGIKCRPASAIGSSSGEKGILTIAWNSSDELQVAGYRIFYGMASGKYQGCVDIGKPPESSPGITKYNLTGLSPGKEYFISVVARDKANNSSRFSEEISGVAK
jgi:hypothetical protein